MSNVVSSMLYVIVAHSNAFMLDTMVFENYKEYSIGFNGKPGERRDDRPARMS